MPQKPGFSEESALFHGQNSGLESVGHMRLKIDSAGRIVIPAEMRTAMMVKPGDAVTAQVVHGELKIMSRPVVMARLQAEAQNFKETNPGASMVDELIADRREESRQEDEKYKRLEREAVEIAARRSES